MVFFIVVDIELTIRFVSFGFVETTITVNLSSARIDDHQARKMDRAQGRFSLPQLPTTTQVCFNMVMRLVSVEQN